ncbi:MAG: hypothetical protein PHU44_00115 [Syntrophales bacterium]|nr:hypothetical protein [Syntrophales bacterium]MDD5640105.1 hypothetical protein [Syntrophales bacterium]
MYLTTLEKVKTLLQGDTPLGPEADDLLSWLITAVSKRVEAFCNREFEKKERAEFHDGGGRYIYLRALPVAEIASIICSDTWDWDAASPLSGTSYAFDGATGMMLYRGGEWPYGEGAVRVTYTGGFDPFLEEGAEPPEGYTPIPEDLQQAVCTQVAYEYRRRNDPGLQAVSFPDGSIQKMDVGEFLSMVKTTLLRYRRRPG